MRASHLLSLLLIGLLLILTPGGSTCLPLPGGRHVHISWNDLQGHDLPSPQVFVHATGESLADHTHTHSTHTHNESAVASTVSASTALGPGSPLSTPVTDNSVTPLLNFVLLATPLATVLWVVWRIMQDQPQRTPPLFLRPPRFA